MSFGVLYIIIIVVSIRKKFQTAATMPELNQKLLLFLYAAIGTLVLQVSVSLSRSFMEWVGIALVAAFLNFLLKEEKLKSEKYLVVALVPLLAVMVIISTVKLISISFYDEWRTWFSAADTFTIVWAIGTWLVNRKQQKELALARERAFKEEQNNRVITQMKDQLEIQVAERTAELTRQKEELEEALIELKATQDQLIQSEKMASLGELTAGIAHEIQNPLNFVNNFSEVNKELIAELKSELTNGQVQLASEIASDIESNEDKINQHGKRADAIVKGMLQHSRGSSGAKEPTDINALADEYIRLSYHGLRAKNKSFSAHFEMNLDHSIGKINLVPQDIGRVFLNLLNNAFFAVNERHEKEGDAFDPQVSISTRKLDNKKVEIRVKDNGVGIPAEIRDKIFQPFFSTKPTGHGTGLGLSISYDIVTKGHGGELRVNSQEGQFTEFIIQLPT